MKNGVFWDVRPVALVITDVSEELRAYVTFEVFTAVTMKNCVFWDVTPCGSCKN
jgi:hypothetical protein